MISLEKTKKAKDKEEKILQKRSSLSEQEIETKKKTVQQSYENIKTLEEQKQNLMKTLNIQSEEDLPSTGFFDRFKRRGGGEQRGGGEGIREYTPNFVMEIFDSFTDQIRGFAEPFIMIKDVVFDLLKPLKLLGKLFMPLLKGFGRLIKMIGLQIAAGLALVAVNLLRVLTDKKVLIGLGAMAALFGLKTLSGYKLKLPPNFFNNILDPKLIFLLFLTLLLICAPSVSMHIGTDECFFINEIFFFIEAILK